MSLWGSSQFSQKRFSRLFNGENVTAQECKYACNANMYRVRVLVKWVFGNFINRFKFNDFKKNLKIALIPVVTFWQSWCIVNKCSNKPLWKCHRKNFWFATANYWKIFSVKNWDWNCIVAHCKMFYCKNSFELM